MTDTELLDALEKYIKQKGFILLHNLTGSDDLAWPAGYKGRGIGLIPFHPRTLRQALGTLARVSDKPAKEPQS